MPAGRPPIGENQVENSMLSSIPDLIASEGSVKNIIPAAFLTSCIAHKANSLKATVWVELGACIYMALSIYI